MTMDKFYKLFHRNPAERALWEKIARRFILPPHGPRALPLGRWDTRETKLKRHYPVRWFIWETLPDFWNYKVVRKFRDTKYWFRYRTTDKYHVVKTGLKPNYYDPDTRMLHVNFQILTDFVEIELASMHLAMNGSDDDDSLKGLSRFKKLWRKRRRRNIRDAKEGLAHLDWEISDTQGHQQSSAVEKKALYLWWTVYRKDRIDTLDHPLIWANREEDVSLTNALRGANRALYKISHNLDEFYNAEDDEMLERLMRIRTSLWT